MVKPERLSQLCLLLRRSSRPISVKSLANTMGITERQVALDIMTLLDMGFPVSGDKINGFWMGPSVQAALDLLTEQEAEALLLPHALKAAVAAGKRKAVPLPSRNLPAPPKPPRERAGPVTLDMIRECVRTSRKLKINYEDIDMQRTARIILPVALFYYKNRVTIAAWCELRQDVRNFRVDRIASGRMLDEYFTDRAQGFRDVWEAQLDEGVRLLK